MKKILILVATLLSMVSCQGFLEKRPEDFLSPANYYETETHLNTALNGVYSTLTKGGLYANHMLGRMGLDADEGYNLYNSDLNTVSDYNVVTTDSKILAYWVALYEGINNANVLLANIDRPIMDENKREQIRGETLFLRAYYYLMLVSRFGDVPLILNPAPSASPEHVQIPRTPAHEVYEQILQDMEASSHLVPDIVEIGHGGRVSKSAVWGIMARVCLYMAGEPINDVTKYEQARNWAEKVITSGYHKLNASFSQVFINYAQDLYDIQESIWEVEFWGNGSGLYPSNAGMVGRNNGIGNTQDESIGYAVGVLRGTRWLFELYGSGDTRRDWTMAPFRYVGNPGVQTNWASSAIYNRYCGKWRRIHELVSPRLAARTPQNYPLLRYSDVLLMYAEADNYVNNGPSALAYEYINQVRRRGYGKPIDSSDPDFDTSVDLADLDQDGFLKELQNERSRELAFECLRKSDLVRWGIFIKRMKEVMDDAMNTASTTQAKTYYTNASERDVIWPIPSYELGINKKLVPTPGW